MSVNTMRSALAAMTAQTLGRADVRRLFTATRDNGGVDAAERGELQAMFPMLASRLNDEGRAEFVRLFSALPAQNPPPATPPAVEEKTIQANFTPWTTTYWPMAPARNAGADGNPTSNLWAKGGALEKFDSLRTARGLQAGARAFEMTPAMNGVVNKPAGFYVPNAEVSEKDAERTTGIDFNGNGKIDANVEYDFINSYSQFGKDGKTDGKMSVGWWGSCDPVALAGILFPKEPKKNVTLEGVTFTPLDIKGLLAVIAYSQAGGFDFVGNRYDKRQDTLTLNNGEQLTGTITTELNFAVPGAKHVEDNAVLTRAQLPDEVKIRLADGTERTLKKAEITQLTREDIRDDAALFHTTISEWLKSGKPAVMDKDYGDHVWNYNFFKAEDTVYNDGPRPWWANDEELQRGFNGPAGDGKITFVERNVQLGGDMGMVETYRYWLEEKNGLIVNSGWDSSSASPDFLWRPRSEATFTGTNPRNPFVEPAMVKELYEKSTT